MRIILTLSFLATLSAPAMAINKCEADGKVTYSDEPCRNAKAIKFEASPGNYSLPADTENANQQAMREKNELKRLESDRRQREAKEDKERQQLARADAGKKKKCDALALQRKWAEEDASDASGKSAGKARRNALRKAEKFQMECGRKSVRDHGHDLWINEDGRRQVGGSAKHQSGATPAKTFCQALLSFTPARIPSSLDRLF